MARSVAITVITDDGQSVPACTLEQAARDRRMSYDAFRKAVERAGVLPIEDAKVGNSDLYAIADITAAFERRVGRGAPGVPRPHRPTG